MLIWLTSALFPVPEFAPPNINSRGKNMSLITDIVTFGTAIGTVIFTLWMVKQVFTDKS